MAVRAIGLLILCTSLPVFSLTVAPIANCSFEVDFCNWTNGSWANGIWHRGKGPRPNEGTGPLSSSPEVEGEFYIYLQSSDFRNQSNNLINPGRIIALVTPELPVVKCVAFLFMKYGLAMGLLSFGVNPNGNQRTKLWEKSNESSLREWTCVNITVPIQSSNNTKVYFEAESGQNVLGDIAMDAVHIYDQDCSLSVGCSSFLNKPIESSTSPMIPQSRSPSSLTTANLTITPHVENSTLTTTTPAPPSTTTPAVETTASTTQVTTSHGHHDITCTESRMEFSIPLSSPHTSETATLSDPNCQINLTRTHVRGGVDLNSCGTTVQFQNDSVIFRNAIIFSAPASSSLGSNGSDDSVSQYQDIIPIECVYNRIATVHLSYMPVVRRVLFTESGVGQFSFNIQQFWDASFTSVVSDRAYPLRLEQDADIFIQLSVGSEGQPVAGHKEIGMEVQQCLVSPSSSVIEAQLHYYPLIQDGCPASSDVHIIPNTNASDSTVMRFRFRAVNFFDPSSSSSSSLVFVHCRMGLCLTGSCKPSAWTCLTPPARRVRRDVDQSRRAAHQLSTGPFLIMADEASASSSSTTATVMAVVSTSVATVAIVVAAIALIALRRRRTTARN